MDNRVRERRLALGLTQSQTAGRTRPPVAREKLSRIEGGMRPSFDVAQRIAAALDCEVADLWPAGTKLQGRVTVEAQADGGAA